LSLGEMAIFDDTVDLQCKMRLELLALRIGETDVGKHVATAFFKGHSGFSLVAMVNCSFDGKAAELPEACGE
jgi:hypothetical protein